MSTTRVEVTGTVQPDGTLVLDRKLSLPAGPVRVAVETVRPPNPRNSWAVLEQIWANQRARGEQPRTVEEIDAELAAMRKQWEEHQRALERIQEEAQKAREQPPC
jgi:hypothetical protein